MNFLTEKNKIHETYDILKIDLAKIKVNDDYSIQYDNKPFKNVCANIIKGRDLKRNSYLQITSIGHYDLIWGIFATIMLHVNGKNEKSIFFAAAILININCDERFPISKMTYFENNIHINNVKKVCCMRKEKYFVNSYVCKSKNLLPI